VKGEAAGAGLAERQALYDLALRYARGVDRRDYSGVGALFTPGGRIAVFRGDPVTTDALYALEGRDGIIEGLRGLERYEKTFHQVANQLVEIEGHKARGETYCTAHHIHRVASEPWNRTLAIRYQDRFVHRSAGWLFAERLLAIDWERDAPLGERGWA